MRITFFLLLFGLSLKMTLTLYKLSSTWISHLTCLRSWCTFLSFSPAERTVKIIIVIHLFIYLFIQIRATQNNDTSFAAVAPFTDLQTNAVWSIVRFLRRARCRLSHSLSLWKSCEWLCVSEPMGYGRIFSAPLVLKLIWRTFRREATFNMKCNVKKMRGYDLI